MPAPLSGSALNALNSGRQHCDMYLSIHQPRELWSARVNGSPDREAVQVNFDGGAGDDFDAIGEWQVVLVGTSSGSDDLGRLIVRSISSGDAGVTGTLTVYANPTVWQDNAYLTFLHTYEVQATFSNIDSSENFYKRRDIAYSGQNSNLPPVAIGGPHLALRLSGGSAIASVPAGESYAMQPGASISTIDVSIYPSTATVWPPSGGDYPIVFTENGDYWVRVEVTDTNGRSSVTFRLIMVHDEDYRPHTVTAADWNGSWADGAWQAGVQVETPIPSAPQSSLAILWTDSWYGGVNRWVALDDPGQSIAMSGYLDLEREMVDVPQGGIIEVSLISPMMLLDSIPLYSITLTDATTVSEWWQFLHNALTAGRIVQHVLYWHTTFMMVHDVLSLTADRGITRKAVDLEKGTVAKVLNDFLMNRAIMAKLTSDRTGRCRLQIDVNRMTDSERAAVSTVLVVEDTHVKAPVTVTRHKRERVNFVFLSGVYFDGTEGIPVGSTAPSTWPGNTGSSDVVIERQMLNTQLLANQLSGQVLAVMNNPYPSLSAEFAVMAHAAIDPCWPGFYQFTITAPNSLRNEGLVLQCIPRSIDCSYEDGGIMTSADFEPEVDGTDGVTYLWPNSPPPPSGFDDYDPDLNFENALLTGTDVITTVRRRAYGPGAWGDLSYQAVNQLLKDPFWRTTQGSDTTNDAIIWAVQNGAILRSTDCGQTWTTVTPGTDPTNSAGDASPPAAADLNYIAIDGGFGASEGFAALGVWQTGAEWRSWICYTEDNGATWTWQSVTAGGDAGSLGTPTALDPDSYSLDQPMDGNVIRMANNEFVCLAQNTLVYASVAGSTISVLDTETVQSGNPSAVLSSPCIARISDTMFVSYAPDSDLPETWAALYQVDGSTITPLSSDYTFSGASAPTVTAVVGISATKFAVISNGPSGNGPTSVCIYTVSGSTLTKGSSATITTHGVDEITVAALSENDIAVCYDEGSTTVGNVIDVSTTTPVVQADQVIDAGVAYVAMRLRAADSGSLVLVYDNGTSGYIRQIGVVGAAMSPNTPEALGRSIEASGLDLISATSGTVMYKDTSDNLYYRSFGLSGSAITLASEQAAGVTGRYIGVAYVSSGAVVMAYAQIAPGGDTYGVVAEYATYDVKGLHLALGKFLGTTAYATYYSAGTLGYSVYDMSGPTFLDSVGLGSASEAQVDAKTFVSYVIVPAGEEYRFYLYGRMPDPFSFGVTHIVYVDNTVPEATSIESGWGAGHCGSMCDSGAYMLAAQVPVAETGPKIHYAEHGGPMTLLSTITSMARLVNPDGMKVDVWGNVVVATGKDGDTAVVVLSEPPDYQRWYDITGNHPNADDIKSLVVL